MSIPLAANLGVTGLADVGYQFFDNTGTLISSRITASVFECPGAKGIYAVAAPTIPTNSIGIYWNSTGTAAAYAHEIFDARMPQTSCSTNGSLLTFGSSTGQVNPTSGKVPATLSYLDVTGYLSANVGQWSGSSVPSPGTAGVPVVDVNYIQGRSAVATGTVTFPNATLASTTGAVGSVTGSVGSISGVTFPTNFSALSISATTGLVDILQTAADKAWITAVRTLTAGTNIVLPAGGLANVTAWTVALTGNITGNLSGSVGSVTGLTASNLDATISSRSTFAGGAVASVTAPVTLTSAYDASKTAAPTAAAIDTQLSGTHGTGAWGGASGSGANIVTVTVNDGSAIIPNALVRFGQGVNQFTASTNSSGVAVFSLDAATYNVSITKSGYSFTPTTLTVSGATASTYAMTAIVIPQPSNPSLCAVYGSMIVPTNGAPAANVPVTFTLIGTGAASANTGQLVTRSQARAVTNDAGMFTVQLPRTDMLQGSGWQWQAQCGPAAFSKTFTTGAAAVNITPPQ